MTLLKYKSYYRSSWALIVGINAYRHVPPLSYASNDADALSSILVEELDFPSNQVTVLKDGLGTKQAILDTFLGFREKANDPDDRVFVFFAGHGKTEQGLRGPIGFLVPVDGDPKNLNTLIRWDDLTRNADLIIAKHILFIMDACYSGLALQRAISPGTQRFVSDMLQRLARQVITAGKADEEVADGGGPQGKHSIFTGYLLEGLQGAAADENGILTANGLMHYVYQKVGKDSRSQQTPHYGHIDGDGDFVLRTPDEEHLKSEPERDFLVKTVIEMPEPAVPIGETIVKPTFAERHGYGDPSHPSFGRNDWSNRLGEYRLPLEDLEAGVPKAFSWLSLIVEPVADQPISIGIAQEARKLPSWKPGEAPHEQFIMPQKVMTTIDSVIFYDRFHNDPEIWGRYLRLEETGNIEYTDSRHAFRTLKDIRCFGYVEVIGKTWQFMFFTKRVLADVGYGAGVRLMVNLVGTRGTILGNFSWKIGADNTKWENPLGWDGENLLAEKCPHPNLQMEYRLVIGDLNEQNSRKIIDDIAHKLGLAYNHQSSPRCFSYNTDVFPWNQYLSGRWS